MDLNIESQLERFQHMCMCVMHAHVHVKLGANFTVIIYLWLSQHIVNQNLVS